MRMPIGKENPKEMSAARAAVREERRGGTEMKESVTYEEAVRWLAECRVEGERSADRNNARVAAGEMTEEEAREEYGSWRVGRLPVYRALIASLFWADPDRVRDDEIKLACTLYKEGLGEPGERPGRAAREVGEDACGRNRETE